MGLNRFCLDAPIVTGLWWILFGKQFSETVSWQVGGALCFAVWTIYVLDRLLDYSANKKNVPIRKQLSPKQFAALRVLGVLTTCGAIGLGLRLGQAVWIQAGVIGLLTALYFLLFRKLGKRTGFPAKEFLIGFCFAAGVGLPYSSPLELIKLGGLIILGTLCTVNCLIISRAEAGYDRESDPSAWFSERNRSFPFSLTLSMILCGTIALSIFGLPPVIGGCLVSSAVLLWLTFLYHRSLVHSIQTISDAALWAPALIGVAISFR